VTINQNLTHIHNPNSTFDVLYGKVKWHKNNQALFSFIEFDLHPNEKGGN